MLSDMTSAFNVDFKCLVHITCSFDLKYPPRSFSREFSSALSKKPFVEVLYSRSICLHRFGLLLALVPCVRLEISCLATSFKVRLNSNLGN